MTVRHQRGPRRIAIVLFACAVAWVMGVRTPRAASFETIEIAGNGRATLTIDEVGAAPVGSSEDDGGDRFGHLEVFAKMTYGSEISVFARGLYARSAFALPRSGDTAVIVVDVDRQGDARRWEAGDRGLRARLYTIPKQGGERFDGAPVSGTLELEAAVVGRSQAAFRIRGWLEIVDPGADGKIDSEDDTTLEVDVTLESTPTPEEVKGEPAVPPPQPTGGFCEAPYCWVDDGYYDGYAYGYGCTDEQVSYETTDDGCTGETDDAVVSGDGDVGDGSTGGPGDGDLPTDTVSDDGGCSGETTSSDGNTDTAGSGCESSDDGSEGSGCDDGSSSSSSSSGCEDSSSSSGGGCGDSSSGGGCGDTSSGGGCGDTSSASGCGSGGCEGDTLARPANAELKAGVDGVGLLLFASAIATWLGGRRREDDDEG